MLLKDFIEKTDDTLGIDATLQDVIDKMTDQRLHHIVIVKDKTPLAIITERDFVKYYTNNISFESMAIDYASKEIIMLHHTRMVDYALSLMLHNNIRKIIIVNNHDEYIGCVEQEDLIFFLESRIKAENVKIHEMTHTGNKAVMINDHHTLKYALDIMITNQLTSLLIKCNDKVEGIISESDIIRLAKNNVNQNETVGQHMHSPIIYIEEYKTTDDMINMMQKYKIRRVVVFNSREEQYYTLTSKDLANTLKGNYTSFIESKFFDTRESFNALSEYIVELVDIDEEQIVFWANSIAKANFNVQLDDSITKVIPETTWKDIYNKLLTKYIIFETIQIGEYFYQIRGHYGTISDDKIIKLFLTDVTQIMQLTKKLENELEQKNKLLFEQAKMAQMGDMIANIAHQWRQPLSVISTTATGIKVLKELDTLNENCIIDSMNIINDNAQFLSKTIDTFRNFLKNDNQKVEIILQNSIHTALEIISTALNSHFIKLINNIDELAPIKLHMNSGEFSQVLINIINNAKDALIERKIKNPWIQLEIVKSCDKVTITIEDNAGGIPQEILPKIFEQYFTTKDQLLGTGLGLHMSYRIISESLHGKLYAQNSSNGAKFFIELPIENY